MKKQSFRMVLATVLIGLFLGVNMVLPTDGPDQSQEDFSVMTFNVGDVVEWNPLGGAAIIQITSLIKSQHPTILGIQEDFSKNIFNSVWDEHIYRICSRPTDAPVPSIKLHGNGLTGFSDYIRGRDDDVAWNNCNGLITNNNDCLTEKGFDFMELFPGPLEHRRFAIHFYNLHADAGRGGEDCYTRMVQMSQLRQYMETHSAGKAVIVVGDFNMEAYNSEDMEALDILRNNQGLQESCSFDDHTHTSGRKLDYILYRGSQAVELHLLNCRVLDKEALGLSDHYPVRAEFRATINHGPLPDMIVTDVWLENSNYVELPNAVWFTIKNIGEVPTSAGDGITTAIWVGDVLAGYVTYLDGGGNLGTLAVNESFTGRLVFSEAIRNEILSRYGAASFWSVEAKGDVNNVIPELDRVNNNLKKNLPTRLVDLTNPVGGGGVIYNKGDIIHIDWVYSGLGGNLRIWLLKDGASAHLIATRLLWDQSYQWTVDDFGLNGGNNFRIKIESEDGVYFDISEVFSIASESVPTITVTSPKSGDDWRIGDNMRITWTSADVSGNVKIELLKGGSIVGTLVAETTNDGVYNWVLGSSFSLTPGTNYQVRVSSLSNPGVYGISDGYFEVMELPGIVLTSPNGGENWEVGSNHAITWSSTGVVGNVKIEYSVNNGSSWAAIAGTVANNGSYSWTVPNTLSTNCLVRISEAVDGFPVDVSGGVFSIKQKTNAPQMSSPAPGGAFPGSTVTFAWTAGTGIERYALDIGNSVGAFDIFDEYSHTETSRTVTNIPIDGRIIYVRLCYRIGGEWFHTDYTYTAKPAVAPQITSPIPGSALSGSTVTFQWSAGSGIELYALDVGNTEGASDIYDENSHTNLSRVVSNIPTDGRTIWVRLCWRVNGQWFNKSVSYTGIKPEAPKMSSPAPGSTLVGSTVTFTWTKGVLIERYAIDIGTSQGAYDIFDEYSHTELSRTVSNLPMDGRTIWVRLCYRINGNWSHIDYSYKAFAPVPPVLISPVPGSKLPGSTVTFKWTAGKGIERYAIDIGSSKGGSDIYDEYSHTDLSRTVTGIPVDGRTIWVRLCYRINGAWYNVSYSFQAAN